MSETPTKVKQPTESEVPAETEEHKPSEEIEYPFPEPTEEQLKEVRQTTGRLILGEFVKG